MRGVTSTFCVTHHIGRLLRTPNALAQIPADWVGEYSQTLIRDEKLGLEAKTL